MKATKLAKNSNNYLLMSNETRVVYRTNWEGDGDESRSRSLWILQRQKLIKSQVQTPCTV